MFVNLLMCQKKGIYNVLSKIDFKKSTERGESERERGSGSVKERR